MEAIRIMSVLEIYVQFFIEMDKQYCFGYSAE
jgi:hypothetical protein